MKNKVNQQRHLPPKIASQPFSVSRQLRFKPFPELFPHINVQQRLQSRILCIPVQLSNFFSRRARKKTGQIVSQHSFKATHSLVRENGTTLCRKLQKIIWNYWKFTDRSKKPFQDDQIACLVICVCWSHKQPNELYTASNF